MPGVVKLFIWKAGNDLLHAKKNLFWRKIVANQSCPICYVEDESVMHAGSVQQQMIYGQMPRV